MTDEAPPEHSKPGLSGTVREGRVRGIASIRFRLVKSVGKRQTIVRRSRDLAELTERAEGEAIMGKQGLFNRLAWASLIALIGAGVVVASVNSSFAANDRGQKNHRCADLVNAKHLKGDERRAEWNKCQTDSTNYK